MRADATVTDGPVVEPTLGELLTHAVRTTVPARLYKLLHLAFPLAVDFAFRGWWRGAAWALALTAFGAWGLADRWLWNAAEHRETPWTVKGVRLLRLGAAGLAASVVGILLLELFLKLLGNAPIS